MIGVTNLPEIGFVKGVVSGSIGTTPDAFVILKFIGQLKSLQKKPVTCRSSTKAGALVL